MRNFNCDFRIIGFSIIILMLVFVGYKVNAQYPRASSITVDQDTFFPAPDFLRYPDHGFLKPFHVKDSTFKFEFYDSRDSLIAGSPDFDEVFFISLFREYPDSYNKYRDAGGVEKPLPVSTIVQRYDRTDSDKWLRVDYQKRLFTRIREFPGQYTAIDSLDVVKDSVHIPARFYRFYHTELD